MLEAKPEVPHQEVPLAAPPGEEDGEEETSPMRPIPLMAPRMGQQKTTLGWKLHTGGGCDTSAQSGGSPSAANVRTAFAASRKGFAFDPTEARSHICIWRSQYI